MLTRFYVTVTWDDWPEGGSYGTVVEAGDAEEAEALTFDEMAEARAGDGFDEEDVKRMYADDWHVVDCFDLDKFIARHLRPAETPLGDVLPELPKPELQQATVVELLILSDVRLL